MRGRIVMAALAMVALVSLLGSGRAWAGVNVSLDLIAQPQLVIVPGTPVAYAPSVPANYFFYNGQYYLFADGAWFVASGYNGPWLILPPAYVPGPLLAVPVRYYRAAPWQWQHWHRAQPPRWSPVWGHQWSDHHWAGRDDRGRGPHPHNQGGSPRDSRGDRH